jgi:hypothetical protein
MMAADNQPVTLFVANVTLFPPGVTLFLLRVTLPVTPHMDNRSMQSILHHSSCHPEVLP